MTSHFDRNKRGERPADPTRDDSRCRECGDGIDGMYASLCEACGGHEDRLGRGYIENQDVDYAEWMARPEVRRALEKREEGEKP